MEIFKKAKAKKVKHVEQETGKVPFIELPFDKQDESKTVKFLVKPEEGVVVCSLRDRVYEDFFHTAVARRGKDDIFGEKALRTKAFHLARKKEFEYNIARLEEFAEEARLDFMDEKAEYMQELRELTNEYKANKQRVRNRIRRYSKCIDKINETLGE